MWITLFFGFMIQIAMLTVEKIFYGESFAHAGDIVLALALFYYQIIVVNVCAIRNIPEDKDND